jgi:RNA recognition motif-containing protein
MTRLFVGNVPIKMSEQELRDLFQDCGKIKYVNIKEGTGFMVNELINI